MKIIKYVLLLIFLFAIAITVFIATQEGKYDIKEEKVINVPRSLLFDYINDYRNWENIGILTENDTTAVFAYSETTAGVGAVSTWKRKGSEGRIKTVKVIEDKTIVQTAVIDDIESTITWTFNKAAKGTKISVQVSGNLTFSEKAHAAFQGGINDKLEKTMIQGLYNLDVFLTRELTTYKIDIKGPVRKLGTYYLSHTATSTIPEMNRKVTEILPKLMAFVKENKITTNGSPFTLYQTYDKQNNRTTFKVCIPIKEEIFTTPGSEIEGGTLPAFQAFKTTLQGYYSFLPQAWTKAHDAVAEKGITERTSGPYIEVYTRNARNTKKPSQWITDIYVPVGRDTIMVIPPAVTQETAPVNNTTTTQRAATTARPAGTPNPRPAATTSATTPPAQRQKPRTTTAPATRQNNDVMNEFQ